MASDHDLRLGDCLDGLRGMESGGVGVILTDPPYSEHVHTRSRRGCIEHEPGTGRAAFNRTKDLGFEHLNSYVMEACALEFSRVALRWVAVFSDTESAHLWREALERRGLEYVRTLFWDKVGSTPQFTGDRPAVACEAITLCHRPGRKRWNGGGRRGIYAEPIELDRGGSNPRFHPTQKPLSLMEALVRDFTDPGELVCDPFAGSGTTGVACKRLGRRFIGWERDPKFHAAAVKRLDASRQQYELAPSIAKPKQATLIAETRPCFAECGEQGEKDKASGAWLCGVHTGVPLSIRKEWRQAHTRRRAQSVDVPANTQGDAA